MRWLEPPCPNPDGSQLESLPPPPPLLRSFQTPGLWAALDPRRQLLQSCPDLWVCRLKRALLGVAAQDEMPSCFFHKKSVGGMNAIKVNSPPVHTRAAWCGRLGRIPVFGPAGRSSVTGTWLGEGPPLPRRCCKALWPAGLNITQPWSFADLIKRKLVCSGFPQNEVLILMQSPKGMGRGKMDQ